MSVLTNQKNLLNLVQDELSRGVVMCAQESNALLGLLPVHTTGGAMRHTFNQITELPTSQFRELGQEVEAGDTATVTPRTVDLKIIMNDFLIDRAYLYGVGNINDVLAVQTKAHTQALASDFNKSLLYGTGEGAEVLGLDAMLTHDTYPCGKEFEGELTMDLLDEALDYVKIGTSKRVIVCNSAKKREITKLMRTNGMAPQSVELFGAQVQAYDNCPIVVDEAVKNGELWVLYLDADQGVSLATVNGLQGRQPVEQGTQARVAIEMISAPMVRHHKAFAVIRPA